MIVRILNDKEGSDKFFDCRNTCILEKIGDYNEPVLLISIRSDDFAEIVLNPGDEIYYMNDVGKTVHVDRRMYNR